MTDETTALAGLLRGIYRDEWINDHKQAGLEADRIAARLSAANVRVAPSPTEERGKNGACLDCGGGTFAGGHYDWCDRQRAVAPSPETPGLREAAQAVVDLTDDLARWDEINHYVVNSQRDYLAGNLDAAWGRLRAALAATSQPRDALDVERLTRAIAKVWTFGKDAATTLKPYAEAVAREYAATPEEPTP